MAMRDILDAPGMPEEEKNFLQALMLGPGGPATGKAGLGKLARQHAPPEQKDPANWGSKVKKRFLKRFCANKAICDMLRTAAPDAKRRAKKFCARVAGSCVEVAEVFYALNPLLEADDDITDGAMEDAVLRWIREHYYAEE